MSSRYAVLVITHNNRALSARCIQSVLGHSADYELVVYDNGSTDGTAAHLETLDAANQHVTCYDGITNRGFSTPCNEVASILADREEPPTYLVLLNNDTEVPPGWLEKLEAPFHDNPKMAITGAAGGCRHLRRKGSCSVDGYTDPRKPEPDYVEGACLMIRMDLVKKHGLFDEDYYFAYCEDADLSLRYRQMGYEIALVPLEIKHIRAATSRQVWDEMDLSGILERNQRVLYRKWQRYIDTGTFERRVTVRRTIAHGDVLLTTPVIRAIKRKDPHARITVMTALPDIFRGNPDVETVMFDPEGKEHPPPHDEFYDLDMAYETRQHLPIIDAYAEVCGVDLGDDRLPRLYATDEELEQWAEYENEPVAVFHGGGTNWDGKDWQRDRFGEIALRLRSQGWTTISVGHRGCPHVGGVDLRGKTSIHELYALMLRADLFVGIDSFPMHVARAAGIAVVSVFGAVDPAHIVTDQEPTRAVTASRKKVACLGCHHYQMGPRVRNDCFRPRVMCMELLETADVWEQVEAAIGA